MNIDIENINTFEKRNKYIQLNGGNIKSYRETNVDEAVTAEAKASNDMEIDLKEEQNTQAYKETMNIYIENINTF